MRDDPPAGSDTTRLFNPAKKDLPLNSHRIKLSIPHMSGKEQEQIARAFSSNWLSTVGPCIDALETRFSAMTGKHAVVVSSGTAAIHLGLKILGVGPGDEVVAPTFTFAATANPVLYLGASPVFVDCESTSWNLDPQLLHEFLRKRAAESRLPKAVIVVHVYGQTARMDEIMAICGEYDVPVMEDAAEAVGSSYKTQVAGSIAKVGVYSFNGNKIITGTAGGVILLESSDAAEKVRRWSKQSREPGIGYLHHEVGYNYQLSNILAGVVCAQLEVLGERVRARRRNFQSYRSALADLPGVIPMPEASWGISNCWLSCFLIDEQLFGMSAMELIQRLDNHGVESRPVWKPLHTQPCFSSYEAIGGMVAERLFQQGVCLPSSSSLTMEELSDVCDYIKEAHRGCREGALARTE
ncbi:MAG: DegT/DnrJ/EryC1/StrS family aminotransferase [Verrucomicrobiales bacterium]